MMNEPAEAVEKFEDIITEVMKSPDDYPDSATFISLNVAIEKGVFSHGKLEILKYLKENDVSSISDLAEKIDRSTNNVSSNITQLEEYGLVETEKDGKKKIPKLKNDHLFILW